MTRSCWLLSLSIPMHLYVAPRWESGVVGSDAITVLVQRAGGSPENTGRRIRLGVGEAFPFATPPESFQRTAHRDDVSRDETPE